MSKPDELLTALRDAWQGDEGTLVLYEAAVNGTSPADAINGLLLRALVDTLGLSWEMHHAVHYAISEYLVDSDTVRHLKTTGRLLSAIATILEAAGVEP